MATPTRAWVHGLISVLGAVLIVGGIAARKPGAWIIGLPIAALNFQQGRRAKKLRLIGDKKSVKV